MPATMVDTEVIRNAVRLACRAPSLHNSQPWRWVLEGAAIQLFANPDRVVRATDSSGREALMACGAVLDHFRVAMAAAGYTANVDRFPNPNNRLHVASVDFTPMNYVTDGHRRRANAILLRRTDRLPFAAPSDWDAFESALRGTVTSEAVRLDTIPDDLRPQLAEASQLTESLRLYDSSYHAELEWWTAAFEVSEGIPHSALVSAAESDRVDVGRSFPVTHNQDRRLEVGDDQSTILVISAVDDVRVGHLHVDEHDRNRRDARHRGCHHRASAAAGTGAGGHRPRVGAGPASDTAATHIGGPALQRAVATPGTNVSAQGTFA